MTIAAMLEIEALTPFMGALVTGVDAGAVLDGALKARLRQAWLEYGLLLLRGQELDEDQQRSFASIFGEVSSDGEYGDQNYVSNVIAGGLTPHGELAFHVDHSWSEEPLRGIMLYAIETPPAGCGGETRFADMTRAFELLEGQLAQKVSGLEIVHTYPDQTRHVPIPGPDPRPGMPTARHPLVYTHPNSGRKFIFCSPRHYDRIPGFGVQEGLALVEELSQHIYQSEVIYEHSWRVGDLVVWDNLRLQHARTDFDRKHRRHLRRTQIGPMMVH